MMIDWNHFTPWSSLAGGMLIGLAAGMLILVNGRIAGISGIVGGLIHPRAGDTAWRVLFVAGLLLAPWAHRLLLAAATPQINAGGFTLVIAGLLVGFGSRLGSGCTSGHGVCGLARLSPRSFAATATFTITGMATVFVTRHLFG
ncbi:MAG TPA: YeeE/YedE family protein [Gammaproteobacteria bacterium]|nr:YeeE/YedE family protein [Gammaproteobacteria bacterium]